MKPKSSLAVAEVAGDWSFQGLLEEHADARKSGPAAVRELHCEHRGL